MLQTVLINLLFASLFAMLMHYIVWKTDLIPLARERPETVWVLALAAGFVFMIGFLVTMNA